MPTKARGKFITFEGSEGSGKSTQINLLCEYLKSERHPVLFVREPGGVKISEKIRDILLDVKNQEMNQECEMLLYMAARAQLVEEVVQPALKQGKIVICDRFLDSTVVYQGYGHRMDVAFIRKVGRFVTQGCDPDLTFLFDIDASKGLARIKRAKDRIEKRAMAYHRRVRDGYLEIARREPRRIKVIPSEQSIEEIHDQVVKYVNRLLSKK